MEKFVETLRDVVLAVGASAIIFIGVNKVFDLAPRAWTWFTASVGALAGLTTFGLLWGNRVVEQPVLLTGIAIVVGFAAGWLLSVTEDAARRIVIGVTAGGVLGLLVGIFLRDTEITIALRRGSVTYNPVLPSMDWVAAAGWTALGIAVGAGAWYLRRALFGGDRALVRSLVLWGTIGFVVGTFGAAELGATGNRAEGIIAALIAGAGFGLWIGLPANLTMKARELMAQRSRSYIFLIPALGFIGLTLVVPTIRTIWLSFLDKTGVEGVGFRNYADIFTDPTIFKVDNWADMFSSWLFWIGTILLVAGLVIGRVLGQRTGHAIAWGGGAAPSVAVGSFLLTWAVFAVMRGTIFNNLWWVVTVTLLATSLGLAVAVLADRAKFESLAKSFIFMPMAISFVGAGIIWRFMYIARPENKPQTGVLNTLWVGLGKVSNSGVGKTVAVLILLALVGGLAFLAYRGWQRGATGLTVGSIATALPLLWMVYRFLGPGLGGFVIDEATGEAIADTILFIQESPFNNVWLMVVLIWIQTGFTMVIFSAAIKAVPAELLEAAKVDGATESQSFWRVVIPQIAPTIGVVVTTLIVTVMKVFDIVKVMTNGNFDTQVIANEMWQRAFTEFNFGLGSALAVVLFLSVLPIMYINIRRMQKEAA